MTDEVDPRWVPLKQKLHDATEALEAAIARHGQALDDAKAALDAAEAQLRAAIEDARALVKDVEEIPPGQYPTVTG